ncbi:hypothetical protein [Sphingobacterium sp. R2]|uniref:hypothetical protein n=1 Tax=Sphingobacterium sp. R2 TaxID=3112958 RepID=UPI00345D3057
MAHYDQNIFGRLDKPPRNTIRYGSFSIIALLIGLTYLLFGVQLTIKKPVDTNPRTIRLDKIDQVLLLSKIHTEDTSFLKTGNKLEIHFGNKNIYESVVGIMKKESHDQSNFSDVQIALEGEVMAIPLSNNLKYREVKTNIFQYLIENLQN